MSSPLSVLVVDDEAIIRQILTKTVRAGGFRVAEAVDGVEALNWMSEHRFEIVISDIRMPRMDGLTLLTNIRQRHPETVVIFVNGFTNQYAKSQMKRIGVDYFIAKPFRNTEINQTLKLIASKLAQSVQV